MAEDIKNKSVDQGVKKVLDEDEDQIIGENEIMRIIRLYLGREADEDELIRFSGMRESERKILVDYVNSERDTVKAQTDAELKSSKVQNDLMTKGMKVTGENAISAMKGTPVTPGIPMGNSMPSPGMGMNAEEAPKEPNYISGGRYSLVQFKDEENA